MTHADEEALLDHLEARRLKRSMRDVAPVDEARRARLAVSDHLAPGLGDDPPVPVRIYRPSAAAGVLPVVLSIHGGAFAAGSYDDMRAADEGVADHLGCAVAAVEYRLAPETRFPGPMDDCYAALVWLAAEAATLCVDPSRIVVYGGSAGGALAAAVCQRARDERGPSVRAQVLVVPVIHDRLDTPSTIAMADDPGFSGNGARGMWALYLGDIDRSATSPYAAPGRASDLSGLPPAYVRVHGRDPLRDEGIEYAQRLMQAGVEVELHCIPGMIHGALSSEPSIEQRARRELLEVLTRYLG